MRGHTDNINTVAVSPDGTQVVSGSEDHMIRIWSISTGQQMGDALIGHNCRILSVAFSPDGTRIVPGSVDATIRIWNSIAGEAISQPIG